MFKLDDFTVEEITATSEKDMIPYMLSGASVLHDQGFTGENVKWAVIDTGADYTHEALMNNINNIYLKTVTYGSTSMDDDGHGTHVASTIVEIAPDIEILPIKALSPMGGTNQAVADAVRMAIDNDVDGINMSISSSYFATGELEELHDLIKEAVSKNIFIAVASGNSGTVSVFYPACFEEVTTCGAVDINKHEALFSTESPNVDVCQVGVDLIGAKLGGGYVKYSGTSMATPMISGLASLLIGKYKTQHDGDKPDGGVINKMLKLFAIDLGIEGLDSKTGAGFISFSPTASVIEMTIGNNTMKVNGEDVIMDIAPYLLNNRTMLPVRYASHGKNVIWESSSPNDVTIV